MVKPLALALALALPLLLTGCFDAGQESVAAGPSAAAAATDQRLVVRHAAGETVLAGTPQSVMVTDWAAFDNLSALGVPVAGIPGGQVPRHLADKVSTDMQRIGSLQEPDIEAIAAARPELLIIASRSRTAFPTLTRIAPTIDASVDNRDLLAGVKENLVTLGRIFGVEARASQLIAGLDARVEEARAAAADKGTALVIVTNGGKMGIYGKESRVSWLYETLNVPSVFNDVDDRDHGGDAVTFEYLLETNPDWLLVIDRDAGIGNDGAARKLLDNALVHQTSFWQNDRIIYLDPSAAYITMHGYDAVMLLLDQVIAGFSAQ